MKSHIIKILSLFFIFTFILTACGASQPAAPAVEQQPLPTAAQSAASQPATESPAQSSPTATVEIIPTQEPTLGSTSTGSDGATLLFVPEGEFTMGADSAELFDMCKSFRSGCRQEWFANVMPKHTVFISAFWIDETEVTNKMYQACVDAGICRVPFKTESATRPEYFRNPEFDQYPVINIPWDAADSYCKWVGRRLPTEAEWEKAARGTDARYFPWGNTPPNKDLLNYGLNLGDTTAVKSYPSGVSPYGAYDMVGNAWEWVADWYDPNYYLNSPAKDPQGPETGEDKVSRGSAWVYYDFDSFVTDRYGNEAITSNDALGFRCAKSK